MKKNSLLTTALAALAAAVLTTGCLGDEDPYNAGFQFVKPAYVRTQVYANTSTDSVVMLSMGAWQINADTPDAEWCTIDARQGSPNIIYSLGVHFAQNTTGKSRLAQFTVRDVNHPDDAHASWQYLQSATRGDGSWGTAALVKSVTSSDGWRVSIGYDEYSRPTQMSVSNPDGSTEQYRMDYNYSAARLTVTIGSNTLTGAMDNGFQAEQLIGTADTVGYVGQYDSYGMQIPFSHAFNYVAKRTARTQAYAYLVGGKSLEPDSLHTADSLIYYCQWKTVSRPSVVERYKLEYGTMDNRCQTVDANQLVLGMDKCDPLQLVAMFRYCRSTSIVTRAKAADATIDVKTELNADRSVSRMVVSDSRRDTDITYEFEY